MEVTVNILELASELAHNRTYYESGDILYESDMFITELNKRYVPGLLTYTEEVQDRFNRWYDYYLSEIEKYKI